MPTSPKTIEEKIERILNAWRTLASDKTFGGMTLMQFEASVARSQAARQKIEDLSDQLTDAHAEREAADEVSTAKVRLVVNGVHGDPREVALIKGVQNLMERDPE